MAQEHDSDPERLIELFDNEAPLDGESAELTIARLGWYMASDNLSLAVFLQRFGVEKNIVLAALQFVEDCNNDYLESLEITLADRLQEPREPLRHPEMDDIEQAISRYAMADVEFTFIDFAALQGADVQPEDLENFPPFALELMDNSANRLMSGTDHSHEVTEVKALSLSEAIEELEDPSAEG